MFASIKAVIFDAVGTLLDPNPAANVVYANLGRRFGSRLTAEEIIPRFRAAFARQEAFDAKQGAWRTSEEREVDRWRQIVSDIFEDVEPIAELFASLWAHFARPESWRLDEDIGCVWSELADRGLQLGIASNFDSRLQTICQGKPAIANCRHLFISSLLGYRKPGRGFMREIERAMRLSRHEIVLVGNDLKNDFQGARGAGCLAVLVDRDENHIVQPSIASLLELPSLLAK